MTTFVIVTSFVVLTFVLICEQTIGYGWPEKVGLTLGVFGLVTSTVVSFTLARSMPVMDAESVDQILSQTGIWVSIGEVVLGLVVIGGLLIVIGGCVRIWSHRTRLFPFLYSNNR